MTLLLNTPLPLPCGALIPNRLAKAAMTEGLASAQGVPTPELERLYRRWSAGGAGLLLTGNVQVARDHLERPGNVVIDRPPSAALRQALQRWAAAGTAHGNGLWMQINHAGRQTPATVNPAPKAPSAVKLALPGKRFAPPVALTEAEILDLIDRFVAAAQVAQETGFTGVQFHAAHGYLLSSFLNPRANVRRDAWGGSLANRARMLLAVVRGARAALGLGFPISVKLNSADFQRGGFAFEDSVTVAGWLQEAGLDLLEISGGSYEQPRMMGQHGLQPAEAIHVAASTALREAYFVDFALAMKDKVSLPLMVTGGFRSRAAMEQALASGAADLIGLGRPLCADPAGARRLLDGAAALERWEARLHLLPRGLRWLDRITLVRAIGALGVQNWYYAQILALGRSGQADPGLSVLAAWRAVAGMHRRLLGQIASLSRISGRGPG